MKLFKVFVDTGSTKTWNNFVIYPCLPSFKVENIFEIIYKVKLCILLTSFKKIIHCF